MSTMNQVGVTLSGQSGTGSFAGTVSPSFTTPDIGTPSAGVLTSCTGLPVAGGGTGNSTFTAYAVICAGTTATGAFQNVSGVGSAGQVLTSGGAAALPTWTNPASSLAPVSVAGTTQAALIDKIYFTQNSATTTVTLPATFALGDQVAIVQAGTGLVAFTANTGQTIVFGSGASTSGGSWTTANQYDTIFAYGLIANTTWLIWSTNSVGLTPA